MLKFNNDNILIFVRNLQSSQQRIETLLASGDTGNASVDLAVAVGRIDALELQLASLSIPQVIDSLVSSSTVDALSANQGRILSEQKVAAGVVVGNKLELTFVDSSKIEVDVTALLADLKLSSGTYNSTTETLDFVVGDGTNQETVSVPAASLLPIQTANHFAGDGTATNPLTLPLSTDAGNQLQFGSDFKLYVAASGLSLSVATLLSLPAETWTLIPSSGFAQDASLRLYSGVDDISESISIRRAGTSFELLSLTTLTDLTVEVQGA